MLAILALSFATLVAPATGAPADTIHLEVGSPSVDASYFQPHLARVRVYRGPVGSAPVAEWTNELTIGDSAGRRVHRWVTRGTRTTGDARITWELLQTYDAKTLAPYGYVRRSSAGDSARLVIDGGRVRGMRKGPRDSVSSMVDQTVARPGFMASASDLVPLAAGLREGLVLTAPVWSPGMAESQQRIFAVLGRVTVDVEGTKVESWKVEERQANGTLYATWYLVTQLPYMVYGEVVLPDGQIQRMTEVSIVR
jgi:hypothetical protein